MLHFQVHLPGISLLFSMAVESSVTESTQGPIGVERWKDSESAV